MHEHVDGSARMKIIPENMNDVWTIVEGIDGKVTVELGSGVALPGVPAVSSVNNQLRHLVDRLPH
jgi:16S rRNA G527 N7-methylase RsmG